MNNQLSVTRNYEIRLFIVLAAVLSSMLIVSFVFGPRAERRNSSVPSEATFKPFSPLVLKAEAVYVYDVRTKTVLLAENENIRLPLASLTKIMAALVAEDLSPPYGTVTVSEEALAVKGDSGLYRDERWSLRDILDFSLLTSSNDGMRAVALSLGALSRADATAEEIVDDFVKEMNRKASELGLLNTYFWNETGLDESDIKGGAYGTARDVGALLEYILASRPALLTATRAVAATFHSLSDHIHEAENTNNMAGEIPGLVASKTGYTDIAGGNLVFVFDPELGRPIIVSILSSTEQGRFEDARTIIDAVMNYINQ